MFVDEEVRLLIPDGCRYRCAECPQLKIIMPEGVCALGVSTLRVRDGLYEEPVPSVQCPGPGIYVIVEINALRRLEKAEQDVESADDSAADERDAASRLEGEVRDLTARLEAAETRVAELEREHA